MNDPTTTPEMKLAVLKDGEYVYSGMGLDEFEITEIAAGNSKTLSSDIREECGYLEMKLKENFRSDSEAETNAQLKRLAELGYPIAGAVAWVAKERHALAIAKEERRLAKEAKVNNEIGEKYSHFKTIGKVDPSEAAERKFLAKINDGASESLWDKVSDKLDNTAEWLHSNIPIHCAPVAGQQMTPHTEHFYKQAGYSEESAYNLSNEHNIASGVGNATGTAILGIAATAPVWTPAVTTGVSTTASTTAAVVSKYYKEISSTVKYSANQVAVAGNYVMNSMRQIKPEYIKNGLKGIRTGFGKGGQLFNTAIQYSNRSMSFVREGSTKGIPYSQVPALNHVVKNLNQAIKVPVSRVMLNYDVVNAVNGAIEGYAGSTPYPDWGSTASTAYNIAWTTTTIYSYRSDIKEFSNSAYELINDIEDEIEQLFGVNK